MHWDHKNIILTDHVIEEYYNDHKTTKQRADINLRYIFKKLLNKRTQKKLDSWSFKGEVHKMRYKNQVIVFKEQEEYFLLITYYKYISEELLQGKNKIGKWMKKKFNPILSGKKERKLENKIIRKENRENRKYKVSKFQKMNSKNLLNKFR